VKALKLHDRVCADTDTYDEVFAKLENYYKSKTKTAVAVSKIQDRRQLPNKTVQQFVNALRELAIQCEFGSLANRMIRDRLLVGLRSNRMQERLLL
jgi:hypothetical protein